MQPSLVVKLFYLWRAMHTRCSTNPKTPYWKDYAARGIQVCDRWKRFENFVEDMHENYRPGLTLDRVKNDQNYSKENCRWATWSEQNHNRRNSIWVETPEGQKHLRDLARETGLGYHTLLQRHHRGDTWPGLIRPVTQGGNQKLKGLGKDYQQ